MNTNSRGRGGIGGARKARAAAAGAKSNTAQIKTLSDLVKSLVKRQNAPTTRASRLWAKLRDHVKVGFFASLLNESETTPASFIDNIESLWLLVHKHSSEASVRRSIGGGGLVDSTTQFVAAGAAKLKEAKFAAERKTRANKTDSDDNVNVNVNANGNVDSDSRPHSADADADADNEAQNKQSMDEDLDDENLGEDIPVGRKSKVATGRGRKTASKEAPIENQASQRSGFGIEGLSFDTVPNVNVTSELRIIAEGLFSQPIIEADYFTVQVNFNRGWKLLLIGLTQAECIGRYMAMCALKIAVPVINDTLLDSSTRQNILNSLVNLMISDCRLENRLKAVYLLGILAHQLGFIREHDNMLLRVFKELIKKLIDIQFKERKLSGDALLKYQADNRSMKIYLIYALGKFTTNLSQHSRYMEDLTIYALSNEFEHGDTRLQMKSDGTLKKGFPKGPLHVVKSVMSTLVHDIKHTEQNEKYVGAIFKSFVSPLLKVATEGVQMVAVQFVSTWLPVTNEDNGLLALDALQTGLKLVKDLEVESFDKSAYDREMAAYKKKMIAEESRMALRAKLLKQLLLTPGTYSRLLPVSDHPGFFADNNSSMFNTKAIAVGLPIHPKSNVLISRPIPNIPGVPSGVTTIPPVFMEPTWFEKIPIPSCYYEASERIGGIPGLPVGYTYAPTKLVDVYAIRGIEKAKKEPELPAQIKPIQEQQQPSKRISVLGRPSATGRVSKASKPQESVAEDTLPEEMTAPGAGFGFVKRRGTLRRVDVERGNDASDLPIPTGTTRQMPQEAGVRFEGMQRGDQMVRESKSTDQSRALVAKKIPPGFLNVSPFAGFDPDAVDSSAPVASAIYKDYEEDVEWEKPAPTGYTFDKNPVLWPNKNLSLKPVQCTTDFPLYAPVLFDIIQPGQSSLQQILCQVVGIDRDVSAVSVQRDSNANLLSAGATFNLFIRNRNTPTKWSCINLQVIDDDYRDAQSFGHRQRSVASLPSGQNSLTSLANAAEKGPLPGSPLPSGFTSTGDPYFPPPVNMPPMPAGYTPDMLPYYGKTPSVKPQPLGITTDGIKFYNSDGSLSEGQRNQVGGYDNLGQPFFIPKGCQLPVPIGFTPDGIAYFDVPSILNQKGIMLLPVPKKDRMQWPTFEEEDDSIIQLEIGPDGKPQPKKVTGAMLLEDLLTQLKVTQAEIGKTLVAERTLTTGAIRRLKDFNTDLSTILSPDSDDPAVLDPEDIIQYLKDSDEFAHLKPAPIRVHMDPQSVQFQTVHSPETKNVVLRYRANRGDREERDFFMSVEPADVFTIPSFHLKLQGEGMSQIAVTFNPILVRSERVEGSLSLIDVTGKRLVSCELIGLRQSFIKITPSSIDAGWMLPEKKKEVSLKIENLSSGQVVLTLELTSEANARAAVAQASAVLGSQGTNTAVVNERTVEEMKKRGFSIPQRALKLGPSESKMVPVIFEPYHLGRFSDGIEVTAPGGDLVRVNLEGVAGIPIALYPENAEDSQAGGLALTPERTEFMKKFRKTASKDKVHTPLTDIDISILQNMMSATADSGMRREAHTVDFGICDPSNTEDVLRCVTIMNLSDNIVSIGLYPHIPALKCKYLVKIPARSATTVEIHLKLSECAKGNIKTAIEVICPEFQNIPLYVKAYVGQPLYFNTWDIVYFKPCPAGVSDQLTLSVINESHYDIEFILEGLDSTKDRMTDDLSYFSCMFSDDDTKFSRVLGFSAFPVTFSFTARQRGPWMKHIAFKLNKAFNNMVLPTCPSGNRLTLVGICIEPYAHLPGSTPDKNGLEQLRLWMSHPKRVLDEYAQQDAERGKRFELISFSGRYTPRKPADDLDLTFQKEEIVFRQKLKGEDPMAQRRAQVQTVISRNKGLQSVPTLWIGSTQFNIEPRQKTLRPGAQDVVEVMYIPPPDAVENVTAVGFAAILSDEDHRCHAIQLLGKPALDFLIFPPCDKEGNVLLDFGTVETSTTGFEVNTKWMIMMNNYPQSYSWTLAFTHSKTKFNPFTANLLFGEMESGDSFPVAFSFKSDTSGYFESTVEVHAKAALDRTMKPIRVARVILRAISVNTSVTGFPDALDFGSTVVFKKKRKTFTLMNNGSIETKVSLHIRGPFAMHPKSFDLAPKAEQEVAVTFTPTESRTFSSKLQIFANQRLYMVSLNGSGGTADLVCEMYAHKDIDFGVQKEGTIAWISIYLTNKGTLPLTMKAISATRPELIKIEYCDVTSTVPYSSSHSTKNAVSIRKNYWGILQRKFQVYLALRGIMKNNNLVSRDFTKTQDKRKDAFIDESGAVVPVFNSKPPFNALKESLFPLVPELRPFYSYHFKIGYLNKYQLNKETDVHFHYMPMTTQEDEASLPSLLREMSVSVTGTVFRPLEFFPNAIDFGITPIEILEELSWKNFDAPEANHKTEEPLHTLQVINMSLEAQSLTLEFISPEFKISGKTWTVNSGEKLLIPVEFHPPKEQTQYRGEARFRHNREKTIVGLTGTGASAHVVADDTIDFGSVKLGSVSQHNLRIANRGLLDCRFILDIVQNGNDFSFTDDEPYEYEGVIVSGTAEMVEIECCCESMASNKAQVSIRWEKVPGGNWQHIQIPLLVQTGLPVFRLTSIELDFKTTYINVNKTLEFTVVNDGNASCYWALESCPSLLHVNPQTGVIPPGGTAFVEVEFVPVDFEQLVAELAFYTDAGRKTLMCYGLVGIPYLMIPQEHLKLEYGITAVDKAQAKTITMSNTGPRPITYEIVIANMLQDGVETGSEFEIFFVQPANGTILPGSTQNVVIRAIPKNYGTTITAKYIISTMDGERYVGNAKVTGGRAIIKIAPPVLLTEDGSVENKTAEISEEDAKSLAQSKNTALFEMTRLAFQAHIENLRDVLSGLRTEDIEMLEAASASLKSQHKIAAKPVTGRSSKVVSPTKSVEANSSGVISRRISPTRPEGTPQTSAMSPKKKRDLQMLQKAEGQLQERIGSEESKRKFSSGTVFDGSDLRAKVNRALELAHSRGYNRDLSGRRPRTEPTASGTVSSGLNTTPSTPTSLDSSESRSEKFLNDLASLESELEVLSAVVKSVAGSTTESMTSTPSSGSSLSRYHAGSRKKNRQPKSLIASRGIIPGSESKSVGFEDLNSTEIPEGNSRAAGNAGHKKTGKKKVKRTKDTQPVYDEDGNLVSHGVDESEYDSDMSESLVPSTDSKSGNSNDNSKPADSDTNAAVKSSGRVSTYDVLRRKSLASRRNGRFPTVPTTPFTRNEGDPFNPEDAVTTSSGTLGTDLTSPLEDLVRLAHFYTTLVNTDGEPELQRELVDEINAQLLASTKGVIKLVKEQLANSWVPNREFLSAALRQVQQSNHVMEALKSTKPSKGGPVVNDFNLGLVRSGDLLADVKLFNLPNMGNLSLDFVVKVNDKLKLRPTEFQSSDENELFVLEPMDGILEPGTNINFIVRFLTRTPGFYQQWYDLESGGEKFMSFSITAMSGIPMIIAEPSVIDFGLVCRNKFDIRSVVISNTGTFKDIWRLESIKSRGGVDFEEELFFPSIVEGTLDPRKSATVDIKFAPKEEGAFSKRYRILWTGEPRLVEVKGTGGGARLKHTFIDAQDISMKGFDWGTTVVGLSYTKELQIQNVGNVEGFFQLSHINNLFRFEHPADFNGNCRLDPSATVTVKIHYSPIFTEKIDTPVTIHLLDNPDITIPLRLKSGTKIWAINGEANFKNMSINDTQTVRLTMLNAGTLEIPFEYALETVDPEMKQFFKVVIPQLKGKEYKGKISVAPEQEVNVSLTIIPKKEHRLVSGKIVLMTELGPGPDSASFPFEFWTYDKQLALDDSKDVSVGRVLVGETVDVGRQLTNFGSETVKYRIRIEPMERLSDSQPSLAGAGTAGGGEGPELKGGKDKKKGVPKAKRKVFDPKTIPWKIRDPTEGYLEPNKSMDVAVAFEPIPENGDEWQDARLVIEKCDDEAKNVWSELSSMKLTGAAGTPKLALSEDSMEFGVVGKGIEKVQYITLRNEGNALLNYAFEAGWDYFGNIYFEKEDLLSGKIVAGESVDIGIVFKPDGVLEYSTVLNIITQLDKKTLQIYGTGAIYKFLKDSLPTSLNFGLLYLGDASEQKVTVHNDCIYPISVQSKVLLGDPATTTEQATTTEFLISSPEVLDISGNILANPVDLDSRGKGEYTIRLQAPLSETGFNGDLDLSKLPIWCSRVAQRNFLQLITLGGDGESGTHVIPVTFKFGIRELVLVNTVKMASIKRGESEFEEADMVTSLDFGEVGYESGGSMSVVLYNRNPFKVNLTATLDDGSKYSVFPAKTTVNPKSSKDFRIDLKSIDVEEGGEIASSLVCKDHLKISSHVPLLAEMEMDITATMIDEPDLLEFPEPIDFGPVKRLFTGTAAIEFRNPVRRSLPYKLTIESNFKELFFFDRGESTFSGIAKPRANVSVPIHFLPKLGTKYTAECTLITDEKNFVLTLVGSGVEPSLQFSHNKIDFGIVGVGAAEFQVLEVTNNSQIPVKFCLSLTGNDSTFSVNEESQGDLELEPGQTHHVKVICSPKQSSEQAQAQIEFINIDIPPHQKKVPPFGFVGLHSVGGKCEFTFAQDPDSQDDEQETEYDESGNPLPKTPTINVNFTKIIQGQRVRKYFEVENCGDTMIDLVITDVMGREAQEDVELCSEKTGFTFSPVNVVIQPRTKQKFAVIAKGLKVGEDVHYVQVRTRTLMEAKIIPIRIKSNILSPESQLSDGLKVFARADNSIDGLLAVKGPTEANMNSDLNLWKIFIPIVRVSLELPSQELQYVTPLEPNTVLPDISSFVIRPPALPKEMIQKAKKWYVNRTSMQLDQTNNKSLTPNIDLRRRAALDWVKPVEKQVFLEKNGRRGGGAI